MADLFSDAVAEMEEIGVKFFSIYLHTAHSMSVLVSDHHFAISSCISQSKEYYY